MSTSFAAQPNTPNHQAQPTPTDADLIAAVLHHLQTQTGHDFSHYKASSLLRRIGRRMAVNEISELPGYLAHLSGDPAEAQALLRECLIGVTEFFRNPEVFAALAGALIPPILRNKPAGEPVRIWVVGCATGEEAYSIAMLLSEAVATLPAPPIQVFATDIDEENLAFARRGLYPPAITEQVSSERLQRFFIEEKEGYRVKADLREKLLFAVHNLLSDPPFSNLDLICCRNVLIYFDREAQEKSFELFHYALRPDGYLFLGTSESADSAATLFTAVDKRHHFYQRRPTNSGRVRRLPALAGIKTLPATTQPLTTTPRTIQESYQAWTLRRYAPPRLLVNEAYEVVYLFNGAGRYLTEPDGAPTQNILQKVTPALRLDLRAALYQAFQKGERTESRLLQAEIEGKPCFIQLHVGPVDEADFPKELIEVVFEESKEEIVIGAANADLMTTVAESELVSRLEEELQRTRERMQTILEEHESSIQESRAANEELQSINEELKSTGEELETSKEELQSMNEELVTVNGELKLKIEELSRANSDLFNLMASTNVGVIFLDMLLQVKRFTPHATELFHLIESDIGRPFAHVAHRLRSGVTTSDRSPLRGGTRPLEMAQQVHATLEQVEEVVQSDNERWYILRLFPYRTLDNSVDGVVITFIDITDWQRAEHELQQRLQQQTVAELGRQALQGDDPTTLLQSATAQISARLGVTLGAVFVLQPDGNLLLQAGVGWADEAMGVAIVNADDNFPIWYALRAAQPVVMENMTTAPHYAQSPLLLSHAIVSGVSLTIGLGERPYGVLGVYSTQPHTFTPYDIDFLQAIANLLTEAIRRHEMAAALTRSETHLRNTVELNPQVPWTATPDGSIDSFSQRWLDLTGLTHAAALGDGWLLVSHPDDRQAMTAAWRASLQSGAPYDMEHRIHLAAGAYRWMRSRAVPHRNEQGVITRWYGATEDIHERKLAEEDLSESEARLRLGMTVAGIALAEIDYNNHTVVLSPEAAALYGLPAEPARVARTTVHDCFHPDDRRWLLPQIEQVLDPQGSGIMNVEHRIVLLDGRVRWLQVRKQVFFTPPEDQAPRPLRSLLAAVDITARKQAEEELESYATALARINDELIRGNAELDQYADIVAHDLREPLRGIRNYATYLLEDHGSRLDGEGLEMVQTLVALSQRMDDRINALLNYASLGRQVLTHRDVALAPLVEEVLTLLEPRLHEAGSVVRVAPGLPTIQGDPPLLTDLFTNLVVNAIKYNNNAEKWVEIGWMAGQDDKVTSDKVTADHPLTLSPPHPVIFYVRDNGIGIAAEHHDVIFQLFRRLHGRDEYGGGVGAGLALAKRTIERHGGRIWLTSQPGAGTTFYFTLGEELSELDQRKYV